MNMPEFSEEIAITIGVVLGLILPFLWIGGIFNVIITGFVATYLTTFEKRSYKIGVLAGVILGVLIFMLSFLTPPPLPYVLPNSIQLGIGITLDGIITLVLGFFVTILIFAFLAFIGSYIAVKIFGVPKTVEPKRRKSKRFIKGQFGPKKKDKRVLKRR
jgi:hypothetical protein